MIETRVIVNQFFKPSDSFMFLGSSSRRLGALGLFVVVLPTLGGCAAAGVASALSGSRDNPSVSVVELQSAAAVLDSSVESSDASVSVGSAGNTITLTGGATTSVQYDAMTTTDAASINVGYSTVRGTFDANSQLTDISITSDVRNLSFSDVYNTGANSFAAYNWDDDTGSGRDEWVAGKNLSYMGFGMWSSSDINDDGGWGDMYRGVYAVGSLSTSLPASGLASYSGASTGWLKGTYIYTPFVADVDANFDFSSGAGTFVMSNTRSYSSSGYVATGVTLSDYNFTAPVAVQQGATSFGGTLTSSGGYSGWVAGTFYGPNADEIGGGIMFSNRGFATFGASR